jgi:hypothetical protein
LSLQVDSDNLRKGCLVVSVWHLKANKEVENSVKHESKVEDQQKALMFGCDVRIVDDDGGTNKDVAHKDQLDEVVPLQVPDIFS